MLAPAASPFPAPDPSVLLTVGLVALGLALSLRLWRSAAQAAYFRRTGGEGWPGWLPVVDDVELFRRAEMPAYVVGLLFVPVVSLYALVMKCRALARLGRPLGWGWGMALIGVLVPAVWATLAAARAARPASPGAADPAFDAGSDTAGRRSGARTPATHAEQPPPAVPALDTGVPTPSPARTGQDRPARLPASSAPPPAASAAEETVVPLTRRDARGRAEATAQPDEDSFSSSALPAFELLVHGGGAYPLLEETVVVGRAPKTANDVSQALVLPDTGRSLSKSHAQFELVGTIWFVTDLASTNGVSVLGPRGEFVLVPQRTRVPVSGEVRLGNVRVMIRPVAPSA